MELNAENMYLLALIETLKQENDILKEEKVAALEKLHDAECEISHLKVEIFDLKQDNANFIVKHKLEISQMIDQLEKAQQEIKKVNAENKMMIEKCKVADLKVEALKNEAEIKINEVKKQKDAEIISWKNKFNKGPKTIATDNSNINTIYPILTNTEVSKAISFLTFNRKQVQVARLRTDGDGEIIKFVVKSRVSMASWIGLNEFDVTLFEEQNEEMRLSALESEARLNRIQTVYGSLM